MLHTAKAFFFVWLLFGFLMPLVMQVVFNLLVPGVGWLKIRGWAVALAFGALGAALTVFPIRYYLYLKKGNVYESPLKGNAMRAVQTEELYALRSPDEVGQTITVGHNRTMPPDKGVVRKRFLAIQGALKNNRLWLIA